MSSNFPSTSALVNHLLSVGFRSIKFTPYTLESFDVWATSPHSSHKDFQYLGTYQIINNQVVEVFEDIPF